MQQPRVLRLDRRVALAGSLDQAVHVGDFDMSAAVVDEVRVLQRVGHQRNAVAARADHLGHRFLGQDELVAAGEVARMQQASRQPGLHRVRGVAAGSLLDLRIDGEAVPRQRGTQRGALVCGKTKLVEIDRRGGAGHQHHGAVQRNRVAERGECAENAVAADHRDLDVLAARELDDQRNDALVREVSALERFVDFGQHHIRAEIGGTQMRTNQFEVVRGQRGQESIWRTRG